MIYRNPRPFAPPKKRKPLRREGKVSGTVRLRGPEMSKLREEAWHRSGGFCEFKYRGCLGYVPWLYGELAHLKGRGAGGGDSIDNVKWSCSPCHRKYDEDYPQWSKKS